MGIPKYESVNSSPNALSTTRGMYDDAMSSSADKIYQKTMEGTEQAKGLLKTNEAFESGLGKPVDQAQLEAIRTKYNSGVSLQRENLRNQMTTRASAANFSKLAAASEAVAQEQELNYAKALEKYKRKQARKKARSQLAGTVLGIVGGVVGGVVAGPGGAMAGYAAGNAVGTAATGGMDSE